MRLYFCEGSQDEEPEYSSSSLAALNQGGGRRRAKRDGVSVNQFVATAVAEKLAAMSTAEFFAEPRSRADFAAFDRLMRRPGGEPPGPDDAIG